MRLRVVRELPGQLRGAVCMNVDTHFGQHGDGLGRRRLSHLGRQTGGTDAQTFDALLKNRRGHRAAAKVSVANH